MSQFPGLNGPKIIYNPWNRFLETQKFGLAVVRKNNFLEWGKVCRAMGLIQLCNNAAMGIMKKDRGH